MLCVYLLSLELSYVSETRDLLMKEISSGVQGKEEGRLWGWGLEGNQEENGTLINKSAFWRE